MLNQLSSNLAPRSTQSLNIALTYAALDVQVGLQCGGMSHHEVCLDLTEQVQCGQAGNQSGACALPFRHFWWTQEVKKQMTTEQKVNTRHNSTTHSMQSLGTNFMHQFINTSMHVFRYFYAWLYLFSFAVLERSERNWTKLYNCLCKAIYTCNMCAHNVLKWAWRFSTQFQIKQRWHLAVFHTAAR